MAKPRLRSPSMADNLHLDLLVPIAQRLISFDDFRSFGAVCKSWGSAATKENFTREHQVPWLMLPDKNEGTALREFYDGKRDKIFKLDLPQTKEKLCLSSLGWIMTQSAKNSEVSLLHPLNQQVIQLPDLKTFEDHHVHEKILRLLYDNCLIRKFILSSSPSFMSDYTVLIMSSEKLAVWSPGDHDWSILDAQESKHECSPYLDITYYNGQFYVVDKDCTVSVCEFGHPGQAETRVVVPEMRRSFSIDDMYLVESAGALLLVARIQQLKGTMFRVFQVPLTEGRWSVDSELSEVKNLGHAHVAEALGVPLHIFFTMPWTPTYEFPHPLARVPQSAGYWLSYIVVDLLIWWGIRSYINDFRKKKLKLSPIAYFSAYHGSISHLPTGYMWSPHVVPKVQNQVIGDP